MESGVQVIGSTLQGIMDGDRFGSATALSSKDGLVLGVGASHGGYGYVRLYRSEVVKS